MKREEIYIGGKKKAVFLKSTYLHCVWYSNEFFFKRDPIFGFLKLGSTPVGLVSENSSIGVSIYYIY